jgi:O-succinylbenzoic acid--CoA ligase
VIFRTAWLAERARISPDRAALHLGDRTICYGELAARVDHTERGLVALGVGPGDVVAVLLGNGLSFVEILHALALRGAALLPLNTRLTPHELEPQLQESGARVLLHGAGPLAELAAAATAAGRATHSLRQIEIERSGAPALARQAAERGSATAERPEVDPERTLALIYTSGTTGTPKGALLPHRAFFWSAVGSALHLGVLPDDRWLACLPFFHVGGLSILLRSALYGTAAIVHERFDPAAVNRALDEQGATLVSLVPSMLARVLDARDGRHAPSRLRGVLLGGAPAPGALIERARSQGFPVVSSYGLTEAASQVATQPLGCEESAAGAGLQPLLGTEVRVIDAQGASVRGDPGEICVRGPTLMTGYLDRTEETSRALRGSWLHTGDIGLLDAGGGLQVLDRRDDLIISGGENIYPTEVESILLEHPAVVEAAVTGLLDREYGRRPAAWLVCSPGAQADAEDLRRFCVGRLARFKIPVSFTFVDALPRNAAGKLERHRLAYD